MMPYQVWNSTLGEISCLLDGYGRRVYLQRDLNRQLQYMVYCVVTEPVKRLEIYDLFPLPGDPSKEERDIVRRRREILELEQSMQWYERNKYLEDQLNEKIKRERG